MHKTAKVYYGNSLAGVIIASDTGYKFIYDADYLAQTFSKPISLTLPLRKEAYHSTTLFPFFDGLIPEGWLLDIAKERWKVKGNDRFALLLLTCKDAIGAVSIIPVNEIE
ncbi:HipA N-terminal domain-containing protein [Chitinophaga pinensis]|uniref:HipA N-terminal domain protein n=1 Tax=Chitinophaga pinensis (strain ATCC 43595 / DSM 2588 / LMG 13176 / NBRC 15968 / NCIMB 11800 / UQM 2034) TaxID=485918 RepID=A0A979FYW5_CHIPD|nr:HipA N-terminal domain-containing protein [Chitinophaga pinensis]ACU57654.1 HipA N-terminal domain protein [Chitinophaga pinensis DSM 2588]